MNCSRALRTPLLRLSPETCFFRLFCVMETLSFAAESDDKGLKEDARSNKGQRLERQ